MKRLVIALIVVLFALPFSAIAQNKTTSKKRTSVLIIHGSHYMPYDAGDFEFFKDLNKAGIDLKTYFHRGPDGKTRKLDWKLISQYNCLIFLSTPMGKNERRWIGSWSISPYREELHKLLNRYMADGGGVFFMPDLYKDDWTLPIITLTEKFLKPWGVGLPLETIQDPRTLTLHPRNRVHYIYTENIPDTPVSKGIKGVWFPQGPGTQPLFRNYMRMGQPVSISKDWQSVVKGAPGSFTTKSYCPNTSGEQLKDHPVTYRNDLSTPPTLFAIRKVGIGRMAITVMHPSLLLLGGKGWVHDGTVVDKGLNGKKSDFGKLIANTIHWLGQPSRKNGKLGGYVQDPEELLHPNKRQFTRKQFPADNFYNPSDPSFTTFKGLVGARSRYSGGRGSIAQFAKAASKAGLDYLVFLEDFGKLTEKKYRQMEDDCRKHSTDKLLLIPGFKLPTNFDSNMFMYGYGIPWPTPSQIKDGKLRLQTKTKDGKLAVSDEDAKNWLWTACIPTKTQRNIGYYNFQNPDGLPVRDLRLFGFLGLMTYEKGKLIEDITPEYLNYAVDGNPPLVGAVDIINSPRGISRAVDQEHYLTYVSTTSLARVPHTMRYGHQYGRGNVYASQGPNIKAWAQTQRMVNYAGEPFVPAPSRIRPLCWVTSDVGLKEIVIYCDRKPYRRFLLNGAKEFKHRFEWSMDRHRILVMEVTDVKGRRAVSAGFEMWNDTNACTWCHDRFNGELWHGPLTFPGPRNPAFSPGRTWDGGPRAYVGAYLGTHPGLRTTSGVIEGASKRFGGVAMEGDMWPTCLDDSVANAACWGGNIYAPGHVSNAYNTWGPFSPAKHMSFTLRRTCYLQRIDGPKTGAGWPFYGNRRGGTVTLMEGTMTIKSDTEVSDIDILTMRSGNFPPKSQNIPLFALRENNTSPLACGTGKSFGIGDKSPNEFGDMGNANYYLQKGGYLALYATGEGNSCLVFNVDENPLELKSIHNHRGWSFGIPLKNRKLKKGQKFSWKYFVIKESLDQNVHNTTRFEWFRRYYGLNGSGGGSGIAVKRGKLLDHFGVVDLQPENGIVEFEIPKPAGKLDLPLGLRFIGFNPRWTVGQFQISGYTPGYFTNGNNVYRNLATDERDMVHLSVFPDFRPKTHSVVGHPVQCDAEDLIIQVTQLSRKPAQYHVAINNPTDKPIKTTLKKCMDLPKFDFPDTPVEIPAGGYRVIKKK